MAQLSQHPMDDFPVRTFRFPLGADQPVDVVWSRTKPEFAVFLNALAMHVPHFERYLVASLRKAREGISDPKLKRDVTAIIGQEANHSHNLTAFKQPLRSRYPDLVAIDDASIAWFVKHAAEIATETMRLYPRMARHEGWLSLKASEVFSVARTRAASGSSTGSSPVRRICSMSHDGRPVASKRQP